VPDEKSLRGRPATYISLPTSVGFPGPGQVVHMTRGRRSLRNAPARVRARRPEGTLGGGTWCGAARKADPMSDAPSDWSCYRLPCGRDIGAALQSSFCVQGRRAHVDDQQLIAIRISHSEQSLSGRGGPATAAPESRMERSGTREARFEARSRRRAAAACNDRHSLASPTPLGHMNATEMWPSG
jgi:hypothetical protein